MQPHRANLNNRVFRIVVNNNNNNNNNANANNGDNNNGNNNNEQQPNQRQATLNFRPPGGQPIRVRLQPQIRTNINADNDINNQNNSITLSPIINSNEQEKLIISKNNKSIICTNCKTKTNTNLAKFCQICGKKIEKNPTNQTRSSLIWKHKTNIQPNIDKELNWNLSEIYLIKSLDNRNLLLKKKQQEIMIFTLQGELLCTINFEANQQSFFVYPRENNSLVLFYIPSIGFREYNPLTGELLREVPSHTREPGTMFHTSDKIYIRTRLLGVECYDKDSLEFLSMNQYNRVVLFISGYNGDFIYFFINRPQLTLFRCKELEELLIDWNNEREFPFRPITTFQPSDRCAIIHNDKGNDGFISFNPSYIKAINPDSGEFLWGYHIHSDPPASPVFNINRNLIIIQSTIIQYNVENGEFTHQPLCIDSIFPKNVKVRNANSVGNNLIVLLEDSVHLFSSGKCKQFSPFFSIFIFCFFIEL